MIMDFLEQMERGRDLAALRRHRGLTTGAAAAGWDYVRPRDDKPSWHAVRAMALQGWQMAKTDAAAIYASLVYPERLWNDLDGGPVLTIDDVIEARAAAADASLLATF